MERLPVAVEVAVYHTVVVDHIAGVLVVVQTDHTVVTNNCLAVVSTAVVVVVVVVVGSSLVDSSFVHYPG